MNKFLHRARNLKNDEFYTLYEDIESELQHYDFADRIVYCNCDNLYKSQFFRYFVVNFNRLKLKKLICTCYADFEKADIQLSFFEDSETIVRSEQPYKIEITEVRSPIVSVLNIYSLLKQTDGKVRKLKENGDFRSEECIRLMKKSDVIVSNPPFSLFREYLELIQEYHKQFLIVGNLNEVICMNVFPYFREEKVHFGYHAVKKFLTPEGNLQSFGNIYWYTNMQGKSRRDCLIPEMAYIPEHYQPLDNFPAVNINKLSEIPKDYTEMMAVPITYLLKHNPDLFEILGTTREKNGFRCKWYEKPVLHKPDGTKTNGGKCNTNGTLLSTEKPEKTYYTAKNMDGFLLSVYGRVLIRRK